jgi:hypothetical protein
MVQFTARERSAPGGSIDEIKRRESARDDFAPRRTQASIEAAPAIQQMTSGAVEKIDAVIAELQHRREAILEEGMRVRSEIAAYAKLNQAAMHSSRVISESLGDLFNLAKAPAHEAEPPAAVPDKEDRGSEQLAETDRNFEVADESHLCGTPDDSPPPRNEEADE